MTRMVFAVGAVALFATAAAHAAAPDPKPMVLRPSDLRGSLAADFAVKDAAYESNAQASQKGPGPTLAQFKRWGRVNGYQAVFEPKSSATDERLVSGVDVFRGTRGAKSAMQYLLAFIDKNAEPRLRLTATGGPIGDEAHAMVVSVQVGRDKRELMAVFWRYRQAFGHLAMSGADQSVDLSDVLRLARKQQARMKAVFDAAR
jgi:hypothetical protein